MRASNCTDTPSWHNWKVRGGGELDWTGLDWTVVIYVKL